MLNFDILKNPANWIVVVSMALVGGAILNLLMPDITNTNTPTPST